MFYHIFKIALLSVVLCAGLAANSPVRVMVQAQDEGIVFSTASEAKPGAYIVGFGTEQENHALRVFPDVTDANELKEAILKLLSAHTVTITEYRSTGYEPTEITRSERVVIDQITDLQIEPFALENGITGSKLTFKAKDEDDEVTDHKISLFTGAKNGYALCTQCDCDEEVDLRDKLFNQHDELVKDVAIFYGEVVQARHLTQSQRARIAF